MEITVHCRKSGRKSLIEATSQALSRELNLTRSHYELHIFTKQGLIKTEDARGLVSQIGPKYLVMVLDSNLSLESLVLTIAHEMVHVKQYARGQIKQSRRGKNRYWMGKFINKDYYDQPWELEAFSKERILANKIFRCLEAIQ